MKENGNSGEKGVSFTPLNGKRRKGKEYISKTLCEFTDNYHNITIVILKLNSTLDPQLKICYNNQGDD